MTTSLPPEISAQLDPLKQCRAPSLYGQCAYPPVRGENFCLEHTRTPLGKSLRDRLITILAQNLRSQWSQNKETAWPDDRGIYMSDAQAEILARRSANSIQASPDQANSAQANPDKDSPKPDKDSPQN